MKCGNYRNHELTTKSQYWKTDSFATRVFDINTSPKSSYSLFIIPLYFYTFFTLSNYISSIVLIFTTTLWPLIFPIFVSSSQLSARHLRILSLVLLQAAAFTSSEAFIIPEAAHKENQHSSSASTIPPPFPHSDFIHNSQSEQGRKLLDQFQTISRSVPFASNNRNRISARKMLLTNLFNKELHEALPKKDVEIIEHPSTQYLSSDFFHTNNNLNDTPALQEINLLSNILQYIDFQTGKSSEFDIHSGNGANSLDYLPVRDSSSSAFERRRKRKKFLILQTNEYVTHAKSVPLEEEFHGRHDWLYQKQQIRQVGRPLDLVNHSNNPIRHNFGDHPYGTETKGLNLSRDAYMHPQPCKNILLREKQQNEAAGSAFHAHNTHNLHPLPLENRHRSKNISGTTQKSLDDMKAHPHSKDGTSSQGKNYDNPNKDFTEHDAGNDNIWLKYFEANLLVQSESRSGAALAFQRRQIKLFSRITFPAYGANFTNLGRVDDETSREVRVRNRDSWKLGTKRANKNGSEISLTALLNKTFIMQQKQEERGLNDNFKNSNGTVSRSNYHMLATPQGDSKHEETSVYVHLDGTTIYNSDTSSTVPITEEHKAEADQEDSSLPAPVFALGEVDAVTNSNKLDSNTEQKARLLRSQRNDTVTVAGGSTSVGRDDNFPTKQAVAFVVDSKPVVEERVNSGKIDHTINTLAVQVQQPSQQEHQLRRQPPLTPLSQAEAAYQNQDKSLASILYSISREQQKIPEQRAAGSVSEREQILKFHSQTKQSNSESDEDDIESVLPTSFNATLLTKDSYGYQPTVTSDNAHEASDEAKQLLTEIDGNRGKEGNGGSLHQPRSIQTQQSRARRDVDISNGSRRDGGGTKQTSTLRQPPPYQQTSATAATHQEQQIRPG